jgi:hypothetical protein
MSRVRLPVGEAELRRSYLAPLFGYLRGHHYATADVTREACARHGLRMSRQRLSQVKRAICVTPPWFVAECCAVIGQPVAEVMGAEWVTRFGEDGRGVESGGTERAPVGRMHKTHPPRTRLSANMLDGVDGADGIDGVDGVDGGDCRADGVNHAA